jgi:hypothetical protein
MTSPVDTQFRWGADAVQYGKLQGAGWEVYQRIKSRPHE